MGKNSVSLREARRLRDCCFNGALLQARETGLYGIITGVE
jgi:hypothetical protein